MLCVRQAARAGAQGGRGGFGEGAGGVGELFAGSGRAVSAPESVGTSCHRPLPVPGSDGAPPPRDRLLRAGALSADAALQLVPG